MAGSSPAMTKNGEITLRVIVDFEQQAAGLGFERAMHRTRRAARIGAWSEGLAAASLGVVADGQVALDEINLFPVVMNERRGRKNAGGETQQSRAAASVLRLVETAAQDLL